MLDVFFKGGIFSNRHKYYSVQSLPYQAAQVFDAMNRIA